MNLTDEEKDLVEIWREFKKLVDSGDIPEKSVIELFPDVSGTISSNEIIERNEDRTIKVRHLRHAICYSGHVWKENCHFDFIRSTAWIHPGLKRRKNKEIGESK